MTDKDVLLLQHTVIEFLIKEGIFAVETHQRLQCAYGDVCNSIRRRLWHFKDGKISIKDVPCYGRPQTVSNECNIEKVDSIIKEDRHVTEDQSETRFGIGHSTDQEMMKGDKCPGEKIIF